MAASTAFGRVTNKLAKNSSVRMMTSAQTSEPIGVRPPAAKLTLNEKKTQLHGISAGHARAEVSKSQGNQLLVCVNAIV